MSGSSHVVTTDSVQNGAAGTRYLYQGWSDLGAHTHIVAPTSGTTLTANFSTQHQLTMAAGAGGSVGPASDWKDAGSLYSVSQHVVPELGLSYSQVVKNLDRIMAGLVKIEPQQS